ncbi:MAG TPA: 3-isopropylmalate dehydratase small subunit [Firmicutes bacterium]|nr:3-isopropylmalate dehydratase small subunit [Bacillota bacterium]
MNIRGKCWKFGDNIDTDMIIPGQYLNTADPKELSKHCLEGADKEFVKKVSQGDVIVAGRNFGCGSSREHAPISIKAVGVGAIIASSFARIFYRNAINIGLPVLESPEAASSIEEGHEVLIDTDTGIITDLNTGKRFKSAPFPPIVQGIMEAGGLVQYVRKQLQKP